MLWSFIKRSKIFTFSMIGNWICGIFSISGWLNTPLTLKIDLKNTQLFEFIKQSLLWFDNSEKAPNFHLLFILKLSDYLGILPKYSSDESLFFDIENGIFTNTPLSKKYVKGQVVEDLQNILGIKFDYNNKVLTNINQRKDMLNFLILYYEFRICLY